MKTRTCLGCPWFDPVVLIPTPGQSHGICQATGGKVLAEWAECKARRAFRILRDAYREERAKNAIPMKTHHGEYCKHGYCKEDECGWPAYDESGLCWYHIKQTPPKKD